MKKLLILMVFQVSTVAFSQEFLNLGFEYQAQDKLIPQKWRIANDGYELAVDSMQKYQGSKSLRMKSIGKTNHRVGACAASFPIGLAKGHYLKFSGKVKTASLQNGQAELWMRIDNEKAIPKPNRLDKKGISGTQDWTQISIEVQVDSNTTEINFGAMVSGEGTAWFDDFELFVDGKKFSDLLPRLAEPTPQELAWLKKYVHPIHTVDPDATDQKDLAFLKKLVGSAQVVALGEATHGSSEIFRLKHRIIQFLTTNCSFNVVSMEANLPESESVNRYVVSGKGDPSEVIQKLQYWMWNTQEVLNLIHWMRISTKRTPLRFTGFDMQFYEGAIRNLESAFQDRSKILPTLSALKHELDYITSHGKELSEQVTLTQHIEKANDQLAAIKKIIATAKLPGYKKEWLLQNVRIIEQSVSNNLISRDAYMAENVLWTRKQNPGSKFIVWAHNGHIKKSGLSMGKHLADTLGKDYVAVGFTFYRGNYTADGNKGLSTYAAQTADLSTYEYFLNALNEPIFILDLRAARLDPSENGKWLRQTLGFRSTGSTKIAQEFVDTTLTEDFDLIVFIRESTGSKLLD